MNKLITLRNGRQIEMRLSDELDEITFYENGNKLGGEFEFTQGEFNEDRFLLRRMYSPIPRQGLGEEVLKFFIEVTGGTIWARTHDGIVRDDGSNLTENAPSFVGKMQTLGLIEEYDEQDDSME